eukprot:UN13156
MASSGEQNSLTVAPDTLKLHITDEIITIKCLI